MKSKDIPITTAIRHLRSANVDFEAFEYDYQEKGGTRQTALELGVDEHLVVKTLVFDADGSLVIVLMHGDREVSTKEFARILGVKKVEPADQKKSNECYRLSIWWNKSFWTSKKFAYLY